VIPRELLRKIRKIEIRTSRLVNSQLAGQYQSVFKGRGMAFNEVRPYVAGDDVRAIDWNVSARMNEPHVKLFTEERDRTVMLLVDMSASGLFGSASQSKREVAAEIAALIAFSAIKNNDRVGLIIFTDFVELFVPAKKGQKHVLRVIHEILDFSPKNKKSDLTVGLGFLSKIAKRKTVAFLISDFLDEGWERSLRIVKQRHDLVPVVIRDPLEQALPRVGLVWAQDLESGEVVEFDTSGPEGEWLRQKIQKQDAVRDAVFRRMRLDVVSVATDRSYVDALVRFFRSRARRTQL
jgi:uncharacterized protein (DUF58 family)